MTMSQLSAPTPSGAYGPSADVAPAGAQKNIPFPDLPTACAVGYMMTPATRAFGPAAEEIWQPIASGCIIPGWRLNVEGAG